MTIFHRPPDTPEVAYEFFAPFAHVPGKFEWCRIRSPTHGTVDCLILLGQTTSVPATVYVNSVLGQKFMSERYPECTTIRVPPSDLTIAESSDGSTVTGKLRATTGPVQEIDMSLRAPSTAIPRQVSYGGDGKPVWGSRWTCWGVDLVLDGSADGKIVAADGTITHMRGTPCIVTRGSFGRIAPLKPTPPTA